MVIDAFALRPVAAWRGVPARVCTALHKQISSDQKGAVLAEVDSQLVAAHGNSGMLEGHSVKSRDFRCARRAAHHTCLVPRAAQPLLLASWREHGSWGGGCAGLRARPRRRGTCHQSRTGLIRSRVGSAGTSPRASTGGRPRSTVSPPARPALHTPRHASRPRTVRGRAQLASLLALATAGVWRARSLLVLQTPACRWSRSSASSCPARCPAARPGPPTWRTRRPGT